MCGIAAFFSQSKSVLAEALQAAVQSLIHRGPDNQSVWLSKDRRVGLGHTRLSIIDLATGDQPIANENERVRIVVNGEFYDFERQRYELRKRGHQFLSTSPRDERSYVEEFAAIFEEAVRLRMRADVPVGCYLSGGLDSCAVLGFAARHSNAPIQAFTLTFDQAAYDEGEIAREMAESVGVQE